MLFYFISIYFIKNLIYDLLLIYTRISYYFISWTSILFVLLVVIGGLCYDVCMTEKNEETITPTTEKLYTLRQLAEILQLSQNHLYIMCRRGDIPYIDVGVGKNREYRFDLAAVKNKLQERDRK